MLERKRRIWYNTFVYGMGSCVCLKGGTGMLPKDPMMLYSFINMKLRDCYSSLEELCEDLNVTREEIEEVLAKADFFYDPETNRFIG